jgi:hypothetical protein
MDLLNTTFDATKYANSLSSDMYAKYFIAFDVRSVHILRIQEGLNDEYENEDGSVLFEHEMIDYAYDLINYFEEEYSVKYNGDDRLFIDSMAKKFGMKKVLQIVADYDEQNGYENYDCKSEHCSVDEMVNRYVLRDGFDKLSSISI